MKFTADANVILRLAIQDNPAQAKIAEAAFRAADIVAIPISALCEFVWVLRQGYKLPRADIAKSLRTLVEVGNVEVDWPAVEAGLDILEAGGDFADGVIAFEGRRLGGETFVTFDREAARLVQRNGQTVQLLPSD
jgi:predicted nucleic-acid-binding protein